MQQVCHQKLFTARVRIVIHHVSSRNVYVFESHGHERNLVQFSYSCSYLTTSSFIYYGMFKVHSTGTPIVMMQDFKDICSHCSCF